MDLSSKKRTLGILHIVYGSFNALIFISFGAIISAFFPFIADAIIEEEGPEAAMVIEVVTNVLRIIFTIIFIISAIPSIIGGIGLLQKKSWGLILTLIAGCVSLLSFPFGTALGAFTLYVFIENNKQKKNDQDQG